MQIRRGTDERRQKFAREMRQSPTDAEAKLWRDLRLKSIEGYKFRRQHLIGGYIVDFYCAARRLAVELDGGQHADPEAEESDRERTDRLNKSGVRVLRFWDHDVLKDTDVVVEEIYRHLIQEPPPQPSPGVPGEGVRGGDITSSLEVPRED